MTPNSKPGGIERGYPNLPFVRRSIRALLGALGGERIQGTQAITREQLRAALNGDRILRIQRLARLVADRLGLDIDVIVVTFRDNLEAPGLVELTSAREFFIEVHSDHADSDVRLAAILAHEVTHIFLHRERVGFDVERENEILTDTAALLLGVGWPMLEAYERTSVRHVLPWSGQTAGYTTTETFVGYMTPEEMSYVLARRHAMVGDTPKRLFQNSEARRVYDLGRREYLRESALPFFARRFSPRRVPYFVARTLAKWAQSRAVDTYTESRGYHFTKGALFALVFRCPRCTQNLRVACAGQPAVLKCPTCQAKIACRP